MNAEFTRNLFYFLPSYKSIVGSPSLSWWQAPDNPYCPAPCVLLRCRCRFATRNACFISLSNEIFVSLLASTLRRRVRSFAPFRCSTHRVVSRVKAPWSGRPRCGCFERGIVTKVPSAEVHLSACTIAAKALSTNTPITAERSTDNRRHSMHRNSRNVRFFFFFNSTRCHKIYRPRSVFGIHSLFFLFEMS